MALPLCENQGDWQESVMQSRTLPYALESLSANCFQIACQLWIYSAELMNKYRDKSCFAFFISNIILNQLGIKLFGMFCCVHFEGCFSTRQPSFGHSDIIWSALLWSVLSGHPAMIMPNENGSLQQLEITLRGSSRHQIFNPIFNPKRAAKLCLVRFGLFYNCLVFQFALCNLVQMGTIKEFIVVTLSILVGE